MLGERNGWLRVSGQLCGFEISISTVGIYLDRPKQTVARRGKGSFIKQPRLVHRQAKPCLEGSPPWLLPIAL